MADILDSVDSLLAGGADGAIAPANPLGYAADLHQGNLGEVVRSAEFLADVKEYFRRKDGKTFGSDEDALDAFMQDRRWRNINIAGQAVEAVKTQVMSAEDRTRLARLQRVYDEMPMFYDPAEGERTVSSALGVVAPVLLDPTNLIGGFVAKPVTVAGHGLKPIAKALASKGTLENVKRGAAAEAAINAPVGMASNYLTQKRDIEIGLQEDDISQVGMLLEGGASALLGGAIGGTVAGGTGVARGAIEQRYRTGPQLPIDPSTGERFIPEAPAGQPTLTPEEASAAITQPLPAGPDAVMRDLSGQRAPEPDQAMQSLMGERTPEEHAAYTDNAGQLRGHYVDKIDELGELQNPAKEDLDAALLYNAKRDLLAEIDTWPERRAALSKTADDIDAREAAGVKISNQDAELRAKIRADIETYDPLHNALLKGDVRAADAAIERVALERQLAQAPAEAPAQPAAAEQPQAPATEQPAQQPAAQQQPEQQPEPAPLFEPGEQGDLVSMFQRFMAAGGAASQPEPAQGATRGSPPSSSEPSAPAPTIQPPDKPLEIPTSLRSALGEDLASRIESAHNTGDSATLNDAINAVKASPADAELRKGLMRQLRMRRNQIARQGIAPKGADDVLKMGEASADDYTLDDVFDDIAPFLNPEVRVKPADVTNMQGMVDELSRINGEDPDMIRLDMEGVFEHAQMNGASEAEAQEALRAWYDSRRVDAVAEAAVTNALQALGPSAAFDRKMFIAAITAGADNSAIVIERATRLYDEFLEDNATKIIARFAESDVDPTDVLAQVEARYGTSFFEILRKSEDVLKMGEAEDAADGIPADVLAGFEKKLASMKATFDSLFSSKEAAEAALIRERNRLINEWRVKVSLDNSKAGITTSASKLSDQNAIINKGEGGIVSQTMSSTQLVRTPDGDWVEAPRPSLGKRTIKDVFIKGRGLVSSKGKGGGTQMGGADFRQMTEEQARAARRQPGGRDESYAMEVERRSYQSSIRPARYVAEGPNGEVLYSYDQSALRHDPSVYGIVEVLENGQWQRYGERGQVMAEIKLLGKDFQSVILGRKRQMTQEAKPRLRAILEKHGVNNPNLLEGPARAEYRRAKNEIGKEINREMRELVTVAQSYERLQLLPEPVQQRIESAVQKRLGKAVAEVDEGAPKSREASDLVALGREKAGAKLRNRLVNAHWRGIYKRASGEGIEMSYEEFVTAHERRRRIRDDEDASLQREQEADAPMPKEAQQVVQRQIADEEAAAKAVQQAVAKHEIGGADFEKEMAEIIKQFSPNGGNGIIKMGEGSTTVNHKGVLVDLKQFSLTALNPQSGQISFDVHLLGKRIGSMFTATDGRVTLVADVPGGTTEIFDDIGRAYAEFPRMFGAEIERLGAAGKLPKAGFEPEVPYSVREAEVAKAAEFAKMNKTEPETPDDWVKSAGELGIPEGRLIAIAKWDLDRNGDRYISAIRWENPRTRQSAQAMLGKQERGQWEIGSVPGGIPKSRWADAAASFVKLGDPIAGAPEPAKTARQLDRSTPASKLADIQLSKLSEGERTTLAASKIATASDLRSLIVGLERRKWADIGTLAGLQAHMQTLARLYEIMARHVPGGVKLPNQTRQAAYKQLKTMLAGRDPGTLAESLRMIERMTTAHGDAAPVFANAAVLGDTLKSTFGGHDFGFRPADNKVYLGKDGFNLYGTKKPTLPEIVGVFHEFGHWAYFNVLTDAERMQFWGQMSRYYTGPNGQFDEAKVKELLPVFPNAVKAPSIYESPQEFFATQFSQWVYAKRFADEAKPGQASAENPLARLWERTAEMMRELIKVVFARFLNSNQYVDKDLVALFQRILPDDVQATSFMQSANPTSSAGYFVARTLPEIDAARRELDGALVANSPNALEDALDSARNFMYFQSRSASRLYKRARFAADKAGEELDTSRLGIMNTTFVERSGKRVPLKTVVSEAQRKIYDFFKEHGHLTANRDAVIARMTEKAEPGSEEFDTAMAKALEYMKRGGEAELTPEREAAVRALAEETRETIALMERAFADAYERVEGSSLDANEAALRPTAGAPRRGSPLSQRYKAIARAKRAAAAGEEFDDAHTSIRERSGESLIAQYMQEDQSSKVKRKLAKELARRARTQPFTSEYKSAWDSIEPGARSALGDASVWDAFVQAQRAGDADAAKKFMAILVARGARERQNVTDPQVEMARRAEGDQMLGMSEIDGIPSDTRPDLREFILRFSHRDDAVQDVARRMAYRLTALIGRTTTPEGNPNFLSTSDVARLAGRTGGDEQIFTDYTDGSFRVLREQVRNLSRTLVRGGDADEAAKSVGALVARTLDAEDFALVANLKDDFSGFARYFAMKGRRPDGELGRIYDTMSERASYLLNGNIADSSVRATLARSTFYGDMLDAGVQSRLTPMFDGDRVPLAGVADVAREIDVMLPADQADALRAKLGVERLSDALYFVDPAGTNRVLMRAQDVDDGLMLDRIDSLGLDGDKRAAAIDLAHEYDAIATQVRELSLKESSLRAAGEDTALTSASLDAVRRDLGTVSRAIEELVGQPGVVSLRPVLFSARRPVAFSSGTVYAVMRGMEVPEAAPMNSLLYGLAERGVIDPARASRYMQEADTVTGDELLRVIGEELATGPVNVDRALRALGYDAIITDDGTRLLDERSLIEIVDGVPQVDAPTPAVTPEMAAAPVKAGGALVLGAIEHPDVMKMGETSFAPVAATMTGDPTASGVVGTVKKMFRRFDVSVDDIDNVRKHGAKLQLSTNAARLRATGARWLADFIMPEKGAGHYERQQSELARRAMPLLRSLAKLPDAKSPVKGWLRRLKAWGPISQPQSYDRIAAAIRRGDPTSLTEQERKAYNQINDSFGQELKELQNAGVIVGDITKITDGHYLPQVWNVDAIKENINAFEELIVAAWSREVRERTDRGFPIEPEFDSPEKIRMRAREMVGRMISDGDGVVIPGSAGYSSGLSDSFFARRLLLGKEDLDKIELGGKKLEDFMINDLEGLIVKYFDGTTRRKELHRQFGNGMVGYRVYKEASLDGVNYIPDFLTGSASVAVDRRGERLRVDRTREQTITPATKDAAFAKAIAEQVDAAARRGAWDEAEALLKSAHPDPTPDYEIAVRALISALRDFGPEGQPLAKGEGDWMDSMIDTLQRKPIDGGTFDQYARKTSKALRNFNSVTLLGFTTLTSLPDVALPLIRSGNFKAWVRGIRDYAKADPQYRDAIKSLGVSMENILHDRLSFMHGSAGGRATSAFFNATLLTPWTSMQREMAAAVGFEAMRTEIARAQRMIANGQMNTRGYRRALRFLSHYGLEEYARPGAKSIESLTSEMENDAIRYAVLKFTNESIFAPNANDIPLWAQTPWGALVFQLKSYPLMMMRMSKHVIGEAFRTENGKWVGDVKPLAYLLTAGVGFGMAAQGVKDLVQSRGGDDERSAALRVRSANKILEDLGYDGAPVTDEEADTFLGWYIEGMVALGGMGLLVDILYNTATQVDNGAFGQMRIMSTFLGPSIGTAASAMNVASGAQAWAFGEGSNGRQRQAVRELAMRVPIIGGQKGIREGVVDTLAGEPTKGGGGGWGSGWGNNSGGW